jgi:RNA polymerase sigma-70 factor (ECF subfamily)
MSHDRDTIERTAHEAWAAEDVDKAASILIKAYGPEILGFLVARLRDASDGSEVFSMFCEDLWRGLPSFQWRCTARVWAYTLARNAANRYAVRADRRPDRNIALSKIAAISELVDQVRTATLVHIRTETKSRMRQLREQLDLEEQAVLELRIDKQLSWTELATVMWDGTDDPDEPTLKREAARLRKRFQAVKDKLRKLAVADGLLPS